MAQQQPPSFIKLDESRAKLKLVQAVFRHGARTPLTHKHALYEGPDMVWDVAAPAYEAVKINLTTADGKPAPVNPTNTRQISTVLKGGSHMGQLTTKGQLQARAFGEALRSRYTEALGFLPAQYQEGVLRARTTNYQRTVATLAGVITGLWGTTPAPLTVVTSSEIDEILYADSRSCPNLAMFIAAGKAIGKELVRSDPDFGWACEQLRRLLPDVMGGADFFEKDTPFLFTDLHDVLTSVNATGKPPPPGFDDARLVAVINRLATKEFGPLVAPVLEDEHGHTVLKMSMGVLLSTIHRNMDEAAASKGEDGARPRLYLFSGHDSTIMPLLSSLGITRLEAWPPYLSSLVFELWEQDGQHVVRVLRDLQPLDIPHCPEGHVATLAVWEAEVVGSFFMTPEAVAHACHVGYSHDTSLPQPQQSEGDD